MGSMTEGRRSRNRHIHQTTKTTFYFNFDFFQLLPKNITWKTNRRIMGVYRGRCPPSPPRTQSYYTLISLLFFLLVLFEGIKYSTATCEVIVLYPRRRKFGMYSSNFASPRGGQRGGANVSPPEFGIFCSFFQNSFSIACLRERNPRVQNRKISVLINYNV